MSGASPTPDETADAAADLPRYVITGGGEPTPEQLAALTVALTPVVIEDEAAEAADLAYAARPAWARAALHENLGRRPFVSADDLRMAPPLFS